MTGHDPLADHPPRLTPRGVLTVLVLLVAGAAFAAGVTVLTSRIATPEIGLRGVPTVGELAPVDTTPETTTTPRTTTTAVATPTTTTTRPRTTAPATAPPVVAPTTTDEDGDDGGRGRGRGRGGDDDAEGDD